MPAVRRLLAQRHFAVLICAVALLLRLFVPTGYMVGSDHGRIAMTICSGATSPTMAMDMPGMHADMADHGKSKDHGKTEMPCAFSGLSAAVLAAVDTVQLTALLAFVMAMRLVGVLLPEPSGPTRLRPPLRGPPVTL